MTYVMIRMPPGNILIVDDSGPSGKQLSAVLRIHGGLECGTIKSDLPIATLLHGLYTDVEDERDALQDRLREICRIASGGEI